MRGLRLVVGLFCLGICLSSSELSPKLAEMSRALIEYVNNNKE